MKILTLKWNWEVREIVFWPSYHPEKKTENFRRTGSGVGFQKRDWQWGSQSMIPHKSESKPRRDSHSSSNFGPEKNGKVGRMSIAQIWFLLLFWGRVVQYLQVNFNLRDNYKIVEEINLIARYFFKRPLKGESGKYRRPAISYGWLCRRLFLT